MNKLKQWFCGHKDLYQIKSTIGSLYHGVEVRRYKKCMSCGKEFEGWGSINGKKK